MRDERVRDREGGGEKEEGRKEKVAILQPEQEGWMLSGTYTWLTIAMSIHTAYLEMSKNSLSV